LICCALAVSGALPKSKWRLDQAALISCLISSRNVTASMISGDDLAVGSITVVAQAVRDAISRRTNDALAVAKARGVKLGNPDGAEALRRAGTGAVALRLWWPMPNDMKKTCGRSSRISGTRVDVAARHCDGVEPTGDADAAGRAVAGVDCGEPAAADRRRQINRTEIHRGSRRRKNGPLKEAGYTSAIVICVFRLMAGSDFRG
jgi:hypothetical protein